MCRWHWCFHYHMKHRLENAETCTPEENFHSICLGKKAWKEARTGGQGLAQFLIRSKNAWPSSVWAIIYNWPRHPVRQAGWIFINSAVGIQHLLSSQLGGWRRGKDENNQPVDSKLYFLRHKIEHTKYCKSEAYSWVLISLKRAIWMILVTIFKS